MALIKDLATTSANTAVATSLYDGDASRLAVRLLQLAVF